MKRILLLVSIFGLFSFALHKFHLSNTKVVYNENDKALQIVMRCFIDDIEKTIDETNDMIIELGNKRELKDADKYLKSYLLNNFKITIDDNSSNIKFLGKEVEKDIIFFYFEVTNISSINKIKVENKILLNTFEDQQNIVRLEINNKKKTFVLKNDNFIDEFAF